MHTRSSTPASTATRRASSITPASPNCESVIEQRRVFIDALRSIGPGEELTYDYQIRREPDDPPNIDAIFACRCGLPGCRGTMLWPPRRRAAPGRHRSPRAG